MRLRAGVRPAPPERTNLERDLEPSSSNLQAGARTGSFAAGGLGGVLSGAALKAAKLHSTLKPYKTGRHPGARWGATGTRVVSCEAEAKGARWSVAEAVL